MRRRITLLLLVLALIASACSGDDDAGPDGGPDDSVPTGDGGPPGRTNRTDGPVTVGLSQGERSGAAADDPVVFTEGTPLDAAAVDGVLDRLPEWSGDDTDQVDFNRPAESLRPPVTGDTIDVPFPADGGDPPPVVDDGPLTVLRHQPDGEVGIAPFMSLTFSQPMVALGTVEQAGVADVPVTMTPEIPGRWQWVGTRTLRFEHDPEIFDRLPMATTFAVVVPAGTESAAGGLLADDYAFTFETPSATVRSLTPTHDSLDLEPVFLAFFDQRVDPDAVLEVTTVTLDGQDVDIRLASDNEIAGDEIIATRVEQAIEGTWVAFRAVEPFTPDAAVGIEIGPEIPSLEGPATTDDVFVEQARTYAPLRVDEQSCRPSDDCQPAETLKQRETNVFLHSGVSAVAMEPWLGMRFGATSRAICSFKVVSSLRISSGKSHLRMARVPMRHHIMLGLVCNISSHRSKHGFISLSVIQSAIGDRTSSVVKRLVRCGI